MNIISPRELHEQLQSAEVKPMVLDVREPRECAYCRIEGSINIPMSAVAARVEEIPRDRKIVVLCHHGMRSAVIVDFLERQGYPNVWNLAGGIHAWSATVDPSLPTY